MNQSRRSEGVTKGGNECSNSYSVGVLESNWNRLNCINEREMHWPTKIKKKQYPCYDNAVS